MRLCELCAAGVLMFVAGSAWPQGFAAGNGQLGDDSDDGFAKLDETSYNAILQKRHFDLTRDQLIALGEQEYRRVESEMITLARQIEPNKSWHDILRDFEQSHHPQSEYDIGAAYQAELTRAKAFVEKKDLVTIPPARELPVVETPKDWAATFPYALYWFPDDVLMVTLEVPGGSKEEVFRSHNEALIAVAAVHEAYPGHRVTNLISPTKTVTEAQETFSEGWGLYSEELMLREGYYDGGAPERRLFALRMLLWRAARALLDGKLHRGDISPEEAANFLTEKIGLAKERARVEVQARYINAPASAATYLVGKRQIEQLRRQVQASEGSRFTLKSFHDRLLSQGLQPVQDIARKVFNMELDSGTFLRPEVSAPPSAGTGSASVNRAAWASLLVLALIALAFAGLRTHRRTELGNER